jgi:succinate-acetate transporter protein
MIRKSKGGMVMFNVDKIAPTREQSIRRIVASILLMIFGIYIICLFNKTIGIISVAISIIITLFHLYFLLARKNSLSSLELKITTGKTPFEDEIKK